MWSRRGLLLAAALLPAAARGEGALVVFAAASLRNALDEAAGIYAAPVRVGYGASNALARQIEQGAPADLFLSADTDWMD